MGRFNLDDYAPVEERIGLFYEDHPQGRILTWMEKLDPPLVIFKAAVYRDKDDPEDKPWATGYAYEKEGEGHVNRTSYIENCETSAIGRALANAGYHGKRDGSPRPSREEMEKVRRMEKKDTPEETLKLISDWLDDLREINEDRAAKALKHYENQLDTIASDEAAAHDFLGLVQEAVKEEKAKAKESTKAKVTA